MGKLRCLDNELSGYNGSSRRCRMVPVGWNLMPGRRLPNVQSVGNTMPEQVGRRIKLSLPRRFVCDLMHYARKAPTVPVQRRMNLSLLVNAREAIEPRP